MRRVAFSVALVTALFASHSFRAESKAARKTVAAFSLPDAAGKDWSFKDAAGGKTKAVVVFFLGTECPVNNAFMPRLGELHKAYADKGVAFVAINSNSHDTPVRVATHAAEHKLPFPILKDSGNVVADQFGARRTPEAFVLYPAGTILYQGRIDDQFGVGYRRTAPTRRDLALAIDAVLAGKPVEQPLTAVEGCIIARAITPKASGSVTYTKQVSRILQNKCQECHRPGQVGPMSLLTYKDAVAWSGMIREVVSENRMPPWHADAKHGTFSNDRSLSKADRATLLAWVKQGCPKGDDKDAPAPRKFAQGWTIGKPDVVFEMPKTYTVQAKMPRGGIPYKHFWVNTNFTEDKWIQAAEARPGSRAVVHHIIVYVFPNVPMNKIKRDRRDGIGANFLVGYAPGDMPLVLAPGQAKKIPKGARLVFQMHYTPDGVEREDRSAVGLIFAKKPPTNEVRTRGIAYRDIEIPAGAKNHQEASSTVFDRDVDLLSFMPHMHLRGKDFKYVATFPNGQKQTLLSVPRYDFGWQSNYRLAKPLRLPAGTRIDCTAHYDNSADNLNNPDPTKTVVWGDQTWEEMMIGFVDYAYVGDAPKK
jgi:peroxiredoxin